MDASLRFEIEWEAAEGVRAPELAATWARLEIWVDGECVSELEDVDAGTTRRSVYGSAYPLAEWIAYNWWFLRAHSRPSAFLDREWPRVTDILERRDVLRWLQHHTIRRSGDGFAWPNLAIVPEGELTRLWWWPDSTPNSGGVRFIRAGGALVESDAVVRALAEFVEAVLTRLAEASVNSTPLDEEWKELGKLDADEVEFCLASARLGLDPFDNGQAVSAVLERAALSMPRALFDDFTESVDPMQIDRGIDWVNASSTRIQKSKSSTRMPGGPTPRVVPSKERKWTPPWELGWEQARALRLHLGMGPTELLPIDDLVVAARVESSDIGLQALGGVSGGGGHVVILGQATGNSLAGRFAKARALWHFAFAEPADRFLLTRSYTTQRKMERAFAAELLAPADGLREEVRPQGDVVAQEQVEQLAHRFRVAPRVVHHQIENQLHLVVTPY